MKVRIIASINLWTNANPILTRTLRCSAMNLREFRGSLPASDPTPTYAWRPTRRTTHADRRNCGVAQATGPTDRI